MTFNLPLVLLGGGLWLLLLGGCVLFLILSLRFKRHLSSERQQLVKLREKLASNNASESAELTAPPEQVPIAQPLTENNLPADNFTLEREALQAQINNLQAQLETQISEKKATSVNSEQEKNAAALKDTLESVKDDLADAEQQIATLDGANQALKAERDSLVRQLESLSETIDATSDTETMREMIVNFTEESRELLEVIEQLGKEKSELQQKIADMEKHHGPNEPKRGN